MMAKAATLDPTLPPTDPFKWRYLQTVMVSNRFAYLPLAEAPLTRAKAYEKRNGYKDLLRSIWRATGCTEEEAVQRFDIVWTDYHHPTYIDEDTGESRVIEEYWKAWWEALPKREAA